MRLIKRILSFFSVVILLCSVSGCDPFITVNVTIENRSDEPICWIDKAKLSMDDKFFYLDKIECNSSRRIPLVFDPPFNVEKGIYHFLIFKESTVTKYSLKELVENDIFDKSYTLSYDNLKNINFTIIYTGD